jgi:hypothetical protein
MVTDGLHTVDEIERIVKLGIHALLVRETILDDPEQVAQLLSNLNRLKAGSD